MTHFFRISFLEKIIKNNPLLFYLSTKFINYFDFLLPYEKDWLFFKNYKINKNTVIIDIGAHLGESIKTFRKYFDNEIYSFEPNKRSFHKLKKLINRYKKIRLFNYALSKSKVDKHLYTPVYKNFIFLDILSSTNLSDAKKNLNRVKIDRKNIFFKMEKVKFKKNIIINKKVSIIKIDVEGAEYDALICLKKIIIKYLPLIFLEYHKNSYAKIAKKFPNYLSFYFDSKNKKLVKLKNIRKSMEALKRKSSALNLFLIHKSKIKNFNI